MTVAVSVIDEYLSRFEGAQRVSLDQLHRTLRRLLPHAEECLKYSMPAFTVQGKTVAGFDGFTAHNSYFPHSGGVVSKIDDLPEWCEADKGTLRFPIGRKLPVSLVRSLIRVRLDEISDVAEGKRFEFRDDGSVKSFGRMKGGAPHGEWTWYRTDGTPSRVVRYDRGVVVESSTIRK